MSGKRYQSVGPFYLKLEFNIFSTFFYRTEYQIVGPFI